jgi:hypothetical protein
MRASGLAASLALIVLAAGCSKPVDVKNGTPQDVAGSVTASGLKFTPGRWETKVSMTKFDIGKDLPPQAQEIMKGMMGKARNLAACLTPEQAAKPGPEFFGEQRSGCNYDHFTMGSGTIDAKMVCKGEAGGDKESMTMTMTGHYTADSYDMKVSSSGSQGGMPIAMDLAMTAHQRGACNGTELK